MPARIPDEEELPEEDEEPDHVVEEEPEEGILLASEDQTYSVVVPGTDDGPEGLAPTQRERMESGLQDTLDLTDWRMPSVRDYFWYILVYTLTIALAIAAINGFRQVWAYVLWGGYLVALLIMVGLIVRSLGYRRGTYSKGFNMATLDLQQAVESALDDVGLRIDRVERPRGAFLRPMIAVYVIQRADFTVSLEGRSHLRRKVVRVGRFPDGDARDTGRRFCNALDRAVEARFEGRGARKLFHEDVA